MTIADTNSIINTYLQAATTLIALVGTQIYCPRLPHNATLPAVSYFTRGGSATPYIPGIPEPSVQFDCWGGTPIAARQVYGVLYDNLQGIQRQVVNVGGTDYIIWSAIEEVQGQDMVDIEIPNYFRVLAFFRFMIKAE